MAAERIRQNGLEQEANALNTQSQDRYQDFSGQQDAKATELGKYFADQKIEDGNANAAATQELNVPQSSSNVVTREEQKQRGKADAYGQQQGEALGNLRSFGDLLGGIGRQQARDAGQIGQIGGFERGSSAVVPYELDSANNAGNGLKLFGDILGLGGTVALGKGLSAGADPLKVFPKAPAAIASADPWSGMRSVGNAYSIYGV
ncbi:hypothetical protein LB543_04920 [Mesorhizobium sp. ESP7-2]|uniref:hypothetical protein n=1 Tax=Mesorhizobium sp. ESP7-2 TaxID=2876622 RepID=UPI001CCBBEDF|nr:hypothetical protein [Mesorhizobium sp. ESP7-2]MBZ9706061.1 hypothetical protein [Mesorhizobium sp. ESP7-2]